MDIESLKTEKNAIILVHNYQLPEVQDIGDFIGDSFGLAKKVIKTDAEVIIFCGVDFMAESAKILNPEKKVIHPEPDAKCPMAAMVEIESLRWMKEKHLDAAVVSYVNTTAEVKAESDICVTSSNAVQIIKKLTKDKVIFIPDTNLGNYVQRFIKDKEIILWPGICPTHHKIKIQHIMELKKEHPQAEVIVHPECNPSVIDSADFILSTQGIIHHIAQSNSQEFIIGTEKELCYRLNKLYPSKTYYPIDVAVCPNMKKITIKKVIDSLRNLKPIVHIPEHIRKKAILPLERMVEFGRGD